MNEKLRPIIKCLIIYGQLPTITALKIYKTGSFKERHLTIWYRVNSDALLNRNPRRSRS